MNVTRLRKLMLRYGPVGPLLVGGCLLWHSANPRQRKMALAGLVMLTLAFPCVLRFLPRTPSLPTKSSLPPAVRPIEALVAHPSTLKGNQAKIAATLKGIFGVKGGSQPEVKQLIAEFAEAIQQRELERTAELGSTFFSLYAKSLLPPRVHRGWTKENFVPYVHDELGDLYLDQVWPEAALREYHAAYEQSSQEYDWVARTLAAYGLAEAYAETGNYKAATQWVERGYKVHHEWCGNAMMYIKWRDNAMKFVWKIARLPLTSAVEQLKRITQKQFPLPGVEWIPHGDIEYFAARSYVNNEDAAIDAAETLAWLYLRHGDNAHAREMFEKITSFKNQENEAERARLALSIYF